jgi:hypothetical protein
LKTPKVRILDNLYSGREKKKKKKRRMKMPGQMKVEILMIPYQRKKKNPMMRFAKEEETRKNDLHPHIL